VIRADTASPWCPTPQRAASDNGNLHHGRIAKNACSDKILEAITKIWVVRTSASCRTAYMRLSGMLAVKLTNWWLRSNLNREIAAMNMPIMVPLRDSNKRYNKLFGKLF